MKCPKDHQEMELYLTKGKIKVFRCPKCKHTEPAPADPDEKSAKPATANPGGK